MQVPIYPLHPQYNNLGINHMVLIFIVSGISGIENKVTDK